MQTETDRLVKFLLGSSKILPHESELNDMVEEFLRKHAAGPMSQGEITSVLNYVKQVLRYKDARKPLKTRISEDQDISSAGREFAQKIMNERPTLANYQQIANGVYKLYGFSLGSEYDYVLQHIKNHLQNRNKKTSAPKRKSYRKKSGPKKRTYRKKSGPKKRTYRKKSGPKKRTYRKKSGPKKRTYRKKSGPKKRSYRKKSSRR